MQFNFETFSRVICYRTSWFSCFVACSLYCGKYDTIHDLKCKQAFHESLKNSQPRETFFFQFLNYFIVVQLQLSAFSPHPSTPPQPNPPPSPASILPLGFVHVSFIVVPVIPSPLPSGYRQIILNFNVFGYILLAFFFY